jgi:hypothetical protein
VLARGVHAHSGDGPSIRKRRFRPNRQWLDEGVEPSLVIQIPAEPTIIAGLCIKMFGAARLFYAVVQRLCSVINFLAC